MRSMNNTYENAYKEVFVILQELNEEEYNKIPVDVIETIKNKMNKEYEVKIDFDKNIKKQELLPKTRAILFNLYRDYCASKIDKEKIIKLQEKERMLKELQKKEKYGTDVFENRKKKNKKDTL